jgi:hypothetical protein
MKSVFHMPLVPRIHRQFFLTMIVTAIAATLLGTATLCSAKDTKQSSAKKAKTAQAADAQPTTQGELPAAATRARTRVSPNLHAEYGIASRDEKSEKPGHSEGPDTAAAQDYAHRAYPADHIPHELRLNARDGWLQFKAADAAKPKSPNVSNPWTLVPLASAEFNRILTFAGQPYFDSGRVTALAITPTCQSGNCRLWVAAAGGGVWRTDDALATTPAWTFVSGSFATNAIGSLTYDAPTGTLYAGTGEANASADSEAGFGVYKSTDGGSTWTQLAANTSVAAGTVDCGAVFGPPFGIMTAPAYSGPAFNGRSISSVVVNGSTIYVGSTRGERGVSAVIGGGVASLAPGLPPFGLWKSTDGGATFTLLNPTTVCLNPTRAGAAGIIQSSFGSSTGVNHVELDPASSSTAYAAAFPQTAAAPVGTGGGVWRSTDGGATWTQIVPSLDSTDSADRTEFAVTQLPNGKTRMYIYDGNVGNPVARFYRSDDVATGAPVITDLTTAQNFNLCTGQCWYDNIVITPAGYPDSVYLGGSFDYGSYGSLNDGRGVIYSTDAGVSFTDVTWDATFKPTAPGSCCQFNPVAPNGIHPDQHALVVSPTNPGLFFEGSDGGLMRSSGTFTDISSQCTTYRGLSGPSLLLCQQLLSRVPSQLYSLNKGLTTLQFQGISVDPANPTIVQGGTQDNGTWQTLYSAGIWSQVIYGDGGQSGFSSTNSNLRFNTFTGQANDGNFRNGSQAWWVEISGPILFSPESSEFYPPVIADPSTANGGTIFQGSFSVWRTQDWGGNQAYLEANCLELYQPYAPTCGDFVQIGPPGNTDLTASASDYRGASRAGGDVAAIQRTTKDTGTLWVATSTGRVFISKNSDASAGSVTYTRLDTLPSATASPQRFVTGIFVDPANPNHAWISYSGYSALTPTTPGHIFSVEFHPTANGGMGDAKWASLDGSGTTAFPDFPATSIVHDTVDGVYASNDWGVLRLPKGSTNWQVAGTGLPMVEVTNLQVAPGSRRLYAATHGRNVWYLTLP